MGSFVGRADLDHLQKILTVQYLQSRSWWLQLIHLMGAVGRAARPSWAAGRPSCLKTKERLLKAPQTCLGPVRSDSAAGNKTTDSYFKHSDCDCFIPLY